MAILKGNRIVRGKLGDVGHRQQFVKEGSGYKRRTVAFQLTGTTTNPQTPLQVEQRTRFTLIQSLAKAFASKGFTKALYRSGTGIGGYQAFIRDNMGAVVGA